MRLDVSKIQIKINDLQIRFWKQSDIDVFFVYCNASKINSKAERMIPLEKCTEQLLEKIQKKSSLVVMNNQKIIGTFLIKDYNNEELSELRLFDGVEIDFDFLIEWEKVKDIKKMIWEILQYLFISMKVDFIVCTNFIEQVEYYKLQTKCGFHEYKKIIVSNGVIKKINLIFKEEYMDGE